jgi:hypothetical protein
MMNSWWAGFRFAPLNKVLNFDAQQPLQMLILRSSSVFLDSCFLVSCFLGCCCLTFACDARRDLGCANRGRLILTPCCAGKLR